MADFMSGCDTVLVLEELQPLVEQDLRALAQERKIDVSIVGKDLAVFVNGGGADDGQVAVRQFGFQYIPRTGISLPVVQQYVDFVNKQDGIVDIPQFFQDVFQAVLNLSFIGGSGNQGGVV